MTRLLIVVPARGGSNRVPRKNLRLLAGRPLLAFTADVIEQLSLESQTVLSTDDEEIADLGRSFGWQVPFTRPSALSGDSAGTAETVLHAVDQMTQQPGRDIDKVLVLQPTSPFRRTDHIRNAISILDADDELDAVIGVSRLHVSARHVYTQDATAQLVPLSAVDSDPTAFVPNGALYLIREPALRRDVSFYAGFIRALEMDALSSLDIDTENDFQIAEALLTLRPAVKEGSVA